MSDRSRSRDQGHSVA